MTIEVGKRYRFTNRNDGFGDEFDNAVVSVASVEDSALVQMAYGETMYRIIHSTSGNAGLAYEDELEDI